MSNDSEEDDDSSSVAEVDGKSGEEEPDASESDLDFAQFFGHQEEEPATSDSDLVLAHVHKEEEDFIFRSLGMGQGPGTKTAFCQFCPSCLTAHNKNIDFSSSELRSEEVKKSLPTLKKLSDILSLGIFIERKEIKGMAAICIS